MRKNWLISFLCFSFFGEFLNCYLCACVYDVCLLKFASLIQAHSRLSLGWSLTNNGIAAKGRLEMSARMFDSLLFCLSLSKRPKTSPSAFVLILHIFSSLLTHPPVAFSLCSSPYANCLSPWLSDGTIFSTELFFAILRFCFQPVSALVSSLHIALRFFSYVLASGDRIYCCKTD